MVYFLLYRLSNLPGTKLTTNHPFFFRGRMVPSSPNKHSSFSSLSREHLNQSVSGNLSFQVFSLFTSVSALQYLCDLWQLLDVIKNWDREAFARHATTQNTLESPQNCLTLTDLSLVMLSKHQIKSFLESVNADDGQIGDMHYLMKGLAGWLAGWTSCLHCNASTRSSTRSPVPARDALLPLPICLAIISKGNTLYMYVHCPPWVKHMVIHMHCAHTSMCKLGYITRHKVQHAVFSASRDPSDKDLSFHLAVWM